MFPLFLKDYGLAGQPSLLKIATNAFAQSREAYQLTGRSLTNMCVSCRKSKTVTGPRVRSSKSFRPSGVNSRLPEARRSLNPVVEGGLPLFGLSGSSVLRKFRGKAFASFRSMSQDRHC